MQKNIMMNIRKILLLTNLTAKQKEVRIQENRIVMDITRRRLKNKQRYGLVTRYKVVCIEEQQTMIIGFILVIKTSVIKLHYNGG